MSVQIAEDVYYVPRDQPGEAIGLNQLMAVPPALTEIELEALDQMLVRAEETMLRIVTARLVAPVRSRVTTNILGEPHGLYYVDPQGNIWPLSLPEFRPALAGEEMDFAIGTVRAGQKKLSQLRDEARR